ncbi:MAG: DNA-3-methyladenine glycosylase [Ignavibacteriales bacterium]|nr:DNA-3-methyladenine glycosylase [Ignavibacteriales bacterium]
MTLPQSSPRRRGSSLKKLPRSFYLRPTLIVAKDLLGKYLIRKLNNKFLIGKIVEVEAYLGNNDPASHSYLGITKRNEVMFKKGGHFYVYFTYGMHFCANIVTEEEGKGCAVLLRAVEPIEGIEVMKDNRKNKRRNGLMEKWSNRKLLDLTNGPAKLCEAFNINRGHNGIDLLDNTIFIADGEVIPRNQFGSSTRIGITNATDKKWRFFIKNNPYISK